MTLVWLTVIVVTQLTLVTLLATDRSNGAKQLTLLTLLDMDTSDTAGHE